MEFLFNSTGYIEIPVVAFPFNLGYTLSHKTGQPVANMDSKMLSNSFVFFIFKFLNDYPKSFL